MGGRAGTHRASGQRSVALLRGINVGGHRKLPMAELGEIFRSVGATDVRTLQASIPGRIHAAIEARYGYDVPVLVRTGEELARAVAATVTLLDWVNAPVA